MKPNLSELLRNALTGMTRGPQPLDAAISFYAQQEGVGPLAVDRELSIRLPGDPNDEVRELLNHHLKQWDWESNAPWTASTTANTQGRRNRIYDLLRIATRLRTTLDEYVPFYQGGKPVLVEDRATGETWYTHEVRLARNFYSKRLRTYLETIRRIPPDALNSMDATTNAVLERLGNPEANSPRRTRGLIVGYVQSGKTTHFTTLLAKAIDAGYRLFIVLSGTTNLLRNQTQRRLDMELVGVENILRGGDPIEAEHDYRDDDSWPTRFISYGKQPSLIGQVDIVRLTGQEDFQTVDVGINPLEFDFEKRNRQLPLYVRENLNHAGARLLVVKKQKDRLKRLLRELKSVGAPKCNEIPALVIDDESDQASVNTLNPAKTTDRERSAINELIVDILKRLPRAQYLGYTATPFANVFVNPTDPVDIYPKDFILSLERPDDYMGAREFHDFEPVAAGDMGNEEAYVRSITSAQNENNHRLLEAIDAFVLSGALKKYRARTGTIDFKHHTMLVHHSHLKGQHEALAEEIRDLWNRAAYHSPGGSHARLSSLLEGDFRKVWLARGKRLGLAFPKSLSELAPALSAALDDIRKGNPVLMVNSAEGAEVPDFERKDGVWKIIVGGAKLSRGYTVEGLTVSYFRRRARMQDTLMQMGRWFGYRPGYGDLVRLYIGRAEKERKGDALDLYQAFESICRDEEEFRAQLAMYEGDSQITPRDVPALVFNSHPQLRPTARNRMFNAELTWAALTYREPTSQSASNDGRRHNSELFSRLLQKSGIHQSNARRNGAKGKGFDLNWSRVRHRDIVKVLENIMWHKESAITAEVAYLSKEDCPIDDWLVLAPQVGREAGDGAWKVGRHDFKCISRARHFSTRFGVYSSPEHLKFAKWLVGGADVEFKSTLTPLKRTGIMLLYPTRELRDRIVVTEGDPVMGFGLVLPTDCLKGQRTAFRVRLPSDPKAVVVDAS